MGRILSEKGEHVIPMVETSRPPEQRAPSQKDIRRQGQYLWPAFSRLSYSNLHKPSVTAKCRAAASMEQTGAKRRAHRRNKEAVNWKPKYEAQPDRPLPPVKPTAASDSDSNSPAAIDIAAAWDEFDRAFADAHANNIMTQYLFLPAQRINIFKIIPLMVFPVLTYESICRYKAPKDWALREQCRIQADLVGWVVGVLIVVVVFYAHEQMVLWAVDAERDPPPWPRPRNVEKYARDLAIAVVFVVVNLWIYREKLVGWLLALIGMALAMVGRDELTTRRAWYGIIDRHNGRHNRIELSFRLIRSLLTLRLP
ncbi:uncharacterized protein DSM5745_07885 [Aspergillus mulundensis]|uniref:Uncharacterized protein n=1 Tax=Aspergillus mulundensis TaxID=1810919 RepID=A0A3D8RF90_9EURO|nr:hypothetical protein DSM5745_07885 [Aspergillus mulundensis]RDW72713.1 hypothetical protein DSM5745_07885 [Aspergillus mulundensis]